MSYYGNTLIECFSDFQDICIPCCLHVVSSNYELRKRHYLFKKKDYGMIHIHFLSRKPTVKFLKQYLVKVLNSTKLLT